MAESSASVCPKYHRAIELIGRRWTGAIVNVLLHGRRRFNEIAAGIPDISDRMLTERLRELEAEALVMRIVDPETPTRVEYELTAKGRALEDAVAAISRWAESWVTEEDLAQARATDVLSARKASAARTEKEPASSAARRRAGAMRRG